MYLGYYLYMGLVQDQYQNFIRMFFYLPGYCKVRVIDARAGDNLLFSVMRQLLTLWDLNFKLDINRTGSGPMMVVSEENFMRLN